MFAHPTNGEGIHGKGYHHRSRPRNAIFLIAGACPDGGVSFRKKLSREKVPAFFAKQPRCIVAMEACGGAHHWGRARYAALGMMSG